MSPIKKIFLVVGVLVLIFLIWQLFFSDGGLLISGYNGVAGVIDDGWNLVTGSSSGIMPDWGSAVDGGGDSLEDANW